ncbi:MAG: hypothetical protein IK064_02125 [Clostridia bacterium]|nr:hypothetical protein [Clostridia bacterium]
MKMTKRIVALILATLTVFAVFSFTACVGGAKGVAKNFCNFMKDYKYEKLVDLLPANYLKEWLDENDMTKSELVKALKSLAEDAKEEAEDEDYKITKIEVYNEKDMKNSEIKDLKEQYEDYKLDIKDGKYITMKVTATVDGDKNTEKSDIPVIRVGGKWCLVPSVVSYYLRAAKNA